MKQRIILILGLFITISVGLYFFINYKEQPALPQTATLIVGTNAEFPPFSFITNDEIMGLEIAIAQEIAQRLNKKMEIRNMNFESLIPEIQLGSIHMIAAGLTETKERAKRVFFSEPYFTGDPLLIVQPASASKIEKPEQLKGKTVIVNQGYTSDKYVSGIEGVTIVRISSPLISNGILALKSGSGDAYIASLSSLQPYFRKNTEHGLQTTPIENSEESYALAVSKKYPALFYQIQSTMTNMKKDGTIEKLIKEWNIQ